MFAAGKTGGGGGGGGVVDLTGGGAALCSTRSVDRVSCVHGCQATTAPTPTMKTVAATGSNHRRAGAFASDSTGSLVADLVSGRCCTGADRVGAAAEMPEVGEPFWSANAVRYGRRRKREHSFDCARSAQGGTCEVYASRN